MSSYYTKQAATLKQMRLKPGEYFRFKGSDTVYRVRGIRNGRIYYRLMDKLGNTYSADLNEPYLVLLVERPGAHNKWGQFWANR